MSKNEKTFAEALKELAEFGEKAGDLMKYFIEQAKIAHAEGDSHRRDKLIAEGDKYAEETEKVLKHFELEYGDELKMLEELYKQ